ncbi:biofilm-forming protein [Bacillus sonorensis]|nr:MULTISPECIES: biofilm-forming protein [Bacillus]MCF7618266.1 biofilm-forming protein [Bacillus sonorensis]MCY7856986.1 biofilm-forming protein [Bacillus sonorensis]MCY8024545.1 biofilm-forming protein [Bacillus sonorensis]MCY8035861.1 biofilm-forming protein [Bacillus sonorensis]MCY8089419.1 biofilm-forming protein [Bacillus sonorensis]
MEQIRNDHETDTAFKADDPKKHGSIPKRTKISFCLNPI